MTASASEAMKVTVSTSPNVRARRWGAHSPSLVRPRPSRRDYGEGPLVLCGGRAMALRTIDVDQHLFESRTTWTDHIDPAAPVRRAVHQGRRGGLALADLAGQAAHAAGGADPRTLGADRRGQAPATARRAGTGVLRGAGTGLLPPGRCAAGLARRVRLRRARSCSRTTACSGSSGWPLTARAQRANARAYNRFMAERLQ